MQAPPSAYKSSWPLVTEVKSAFAQESALPQGCSGGSEVKNLPSTAGDTGLIPGSGRSPEEGYDSSIPAWEIPWMEEPGGLQSLVPQKSGRTEGLNNNNCPPPLCWPPKCSNLSFPPALPLYWLLSIERPSWIPFTVHNKIEKETLCIEILEIFFKCCHKTV